MPSEDPRAAFSAALRELRDRVPRLTDEALARRVTSGGRVTVNARRLGEWVNGQSVPRSFDIVLAVVTAIDPAQPVRRWQKLWTAARDHRSPAPPRTRVVVGRPPSDAAALRPRTALTAEVRAAFRDEDVRQVVLAGAGGVGKSQLAAAVFHAVPAELAVWVPASTRQSVLACYARAWRAVVESPAERGWDDETQADLFVAWLRSTPTRWLVVLDDVEEPGDLSGLWPVGDAGRSIVTTRRREAALRRPTSRVVEVGMFGPDEAVSYLTERLPAQDHLAELADALGRFPLALSQAAAFLIDTGMALPEYLRLLADQRERVADLLPSSSPADEHGDTVVDTLRLALDRASTLAPQGTVRAMLELVSVLSPDGIPEAVLLSAAARRWLGAEGGRVNLLALRALHRLSIITHSGGTVEVHALVQRAVRDTVEHGAALARAAADALEEVWPSGDPAALFPIATLLFSRDSKALWADGMHPLLRRLGEHLRATNRLAAAHELVSGLIADAERDRDLLFLRAQLANIEVEQGKATTVLPGLRELRREADRVLGPHDRDVLWIRLWEVDALMETGMISTALESSLALAATDVLADDDPLLLTALDLAALCRGLTGDFTGARDDCAALVPRLEATFGPADPLTLNTLTNLGRWIGETGDPRGAIATFQRALETLETVVGRLHKTTCTARHNLAYWRAIAGDIDAAVTDFVTAAADAETALGADHPTTLTLQANLLYWQGMADDPDALARLKSLQDKVDAVFGVDHPRALRTRQQALELLHRSGARDTAITELRTLLTRMTQVQGDSHPRTVEARTLLADWGRS